MMYLSPREESAVSTEQESDVRAIIARIDAAWRHGRFEGLEECFDERAVIVGPDYREYAAGGKACAQSYREFAATATVIEYSEFNHDLRLWPATAVYTFSWEMTYRRTHGPKTEKGTDQLVLGRVADGWRVLFRHIQFAPIPERR